jgi:F0F1-type ATP synthase membrane subunit b/b'
MAATIGGQTNFMQNHVNMANMMHQASEIIANATKQASSVVEEAKSVASQEAQRIKTQAHGEIEQESQRVRNELKDQVSDLVPLKHPSSLHEIYSAEQSQKLH